LTLLDKVEDTAHRDRHAAKALEHGWSRSVLVMHIETAAHVRAGNALTNFAERLPPPQSGLARGTLSSRWVSPSIN